MRNPSKFPGILILLFIVVLSTISFRASLPPAVIPADNTTEFSAERAMKYLHKVAAEPHAVGTDAHRRVREYIIDYCKSKGLEVTVQSGVNYDTWNGGVSADFVENIIARMKGTKPDGKAILVASHYDSQINTAAAADDGAAVAAKMEVIDMLTQGAPLENDVIFLFTDSEEMGLNGADYFVDNFEHVDEIGLVLNFESRGNSGTAYSFETTTENGWMLREFKKAVKKPVTNALAYEIYKLMPNGTDFTEFKRMEKTGINSAFIDGWAYYHSPVDTPENIDQRSLQHHGDHMLGMLRHFGNMDLSDTKASDVIFFNPLGGWLWIYSQILDLPLMILTVVLWLACCITSNRQKRTSWPGVTKGFGLMILALVCSMVLLFVYQYLTHSLASVDSTWFASNTYQMGNTLLVVVGLAIIAFGMVFKRSLKKSFESIYLGSMLFLLLLLVPLKLFVPTGGYVLYIPMLIALSLYLISLMFRVKPEGNQYALSQMISLFLPLGMWTPMAYMIFIVFGMQLPYGSMVFLVFFFPFLIPAYKMLQDVMPRLVLYLGLLIALVGQVLLLTGKGYTETTPQFTSLNYLIDETGAYWYGPANPSDDWSAKELEGGEINNGLTVTLNANRGRNYFTKKAELVDTDSLLIEIVAEDTTSDRRALTLLVTPVRDMVMLNMLLPAMAEVTAIKGEMLKDRAESGDGSVYLSLMGVRDRPFEINLSLPLEGDPAYLVQYRKLGLPEQLLAAPMPEHIVHGLYNSNYFVVNSLRSF